tara:strand:+ start:456 stop:845 length:390 start_codon:yes stop_codon:yes gene_type:complete
MSKKLPDNIVFNDDKFDANTKNYPTTISAPSFAPINVDRSDSIKADKYFNSRLNELKAEYENLVDEYKWSDIIYNSLYNFQPILGEPYYLYLNDDNKHFLSIIEPNEWDQIFVGTFKLLNNGKWEKIIA